MMAFEYFGRAYFQAVGRSMSYELWVDRSIGHVEHCLEFVDSRPEFTQALRLSNSLHRISVLLTMCCSVRLFR